NPNSKTPNPKPQTPHPKPHIPNPKPLTPNSKPPTPHPKLQTPNPKLQTPNPKPLGQTSHPKPRTQLDVPSKGLFNCARQPGPPSRIARVVERDDHGLHIPPSKGYYVHLRFPGTLFLNRWTRPHLFGRMRSVCTTLRMYE
ncbi:hypothetical protein T484DRAFT_1615613, partial [Baffinella frigidus]